MSRQILQEIGKEQIELGWEMFVNNFLGFIDWNNNENIVIDGVRHIEFFNTLMEQIKPCKVVLVWVEIDENTMAIRMKFFRAYGRRKFRANKAKSRYCYSEW